MTREKVTTEELLALAESNGYKGGAHQGEDHNRDPRKHNDKNKKDQDSALDRYVLSGIVDPKMLAYLNTDGVLSEKIQEPI